MGAACRGAQSDIPVTLRFRLMLLFTLLLLTGVGAGLYAWRVVSEYARANERTEEARRLAMTIRSLQRLVYRSALSRVLEMHGGAPIAPPTPATQPETMPPLARGGAPTEIESQLESLRDEAIGEEERKAISDVWRRYRELHRMLSADVTAADLSRIGPEWNRFELSLDSLRAQFDSRVLEEWKRTTELGYRAQVAVSSACVLMGLEVLLAMYLLRRWVLMPVQRLAEAARILGAGNLDHRVRLPGRDELTMLADQMNDMAARLQAHQARLIEARELAALGAISSSVAHGMRNPLAGIRATAQMVRDEADRPALRQRAEDIIAEVDRLNRRITRLLDFSRPSRIHYQSCAAAELVQAARQETQPLLAEQGIVFAFEDRSGGRRVRVDPDKIVQCLAELFTNAAHHTPAGGRITVLAEPARLDQRGAPALALIVQDTGRGMDERTRRQVFDLFFSTRPEGTGMGLACVKRLVEMHGGQIDVESAPGQGCRVTVLLPLWASEGGDPWDEPAEARTPAPTSAASEAS